MDKVLLKCINVDGVDDIFTLNRVYEAYKQQDRDYSDWVYVVDLGDDWTHTFTLEPDEEGLSYKTWFELEGIRA